MNDLLNEAGPLAIWILLSLGLMGAGWLLIDLLTPGDLRHQVSQSINAAVLAGGKILSSAIIVFAAISLSDDALATGAMQAISYSLVGLVAAGITFLLVDLLLPARVRHLVNEKAFDPAVLVALGADLGVALVIAAAIS